MMMNTGSEKSIFYALFILLLSITGMSACTSSLSDEKITDISLVAAEIEITQNPEDKAANSVVVTLLDKHGRRISNDSVSIIVNGVERQVQHRQGLYYTNESVYTFSDVPVVETYNVAIKLADGTTSLLGVINALREEQEENIICQERGDLNSDFIISWKNMLDIDEMVVSMSVLQKNSPPNEKNYDYKPQKILKIGRNGNYTIPKSSYVDDSTIISGLEFDFRTTKSGITNPKLLPASKITIQTLMEKNVNFEEE